MNVGHQFRGKADGIDRAPAGVVGGTGDVGDAAGLLRRDDAGDIGGVVAEIGDDGVGRGLDRRHPATLRQCDPLDHAGIQFLPGGLEQFLLREGVLGVEDQNLRARLVVLQVMRDQAGALVRRGRTAQRGGRHRQHESAAIGHGFDLLAKQRCLFAGLPGVRHLERSGFVITGQGVEAQVDAGRQHQPVVAERSAVGQGDGARLRSRSWLRLAQRRSRRRRRSCHR